MAADADDLELLRRSHETGALLMVVVTRCAYSCCGRGWRRKDGYEQIYNGHVTRLEPDFFVLTSVGLGTISYLIDARLEHVEMVSEVV